MATAAQRHHLRTLMDELHAHRAQLDYPPHDVRGTADRRTFALTETQAMHVLGAGGRLSMDCSEFATELLHWVGCADPNGLHYRYAGYTGTMLAHLPHYSNPKAAGIGALVVYGPGTGEHVAMVHTPDPKRGNPLLCSHGRPGLDFVYLRDESSWHKPPVTFLSIAHL
jgi:hypothetical protein